MKNDAGKHEDPLNNSGGDYAYSTDYFYDMGGNAYMARNTLASWVGPVEEDGATAYTVPNAHAIATNSLPYSQAFGRDACSLCGSRDVTMDQPGAVKQLLLDYGTFDVAYFHKASYYSSDESSYYQRETTEANHAVALVGWDDACDRTKFKPFNGSLLSKDGA